MLQEYLIAECPFGVVEPPCSVREATGTFFESYWTLREGMSVLEGQRELLRGRSGHVGF